MYTAAGPPPWDIGRPQPEFVRLAEAGLLRPDGTCYLMCFSDLQEGTMGPRRIHKDEIVAAFSDGWSVADIAAAEFVVNPGFSDRSAARAWLATIPASERRMR